jgi:signal transduction histidine kinase
MTEMVVLHELVFDDEGDAVNYRITDCNNAFTEVTGIKREDAVGKLATEVYQIQPAPYLEEYSRVASSGIPYEYTTYYEPMDKHFSISVVSPKKNSFATITTDITGIRQVQEVISAKNKELENYLFIASHDLRSPLVNIQGFSRRLQKQFETITSILSGCPLPQDIKSEIDVITEEGLPKTLNFIFSSVAKMDNLLNGLLQVSRTGRALMIMKEIDANHLLKMIIGNYNYQLTELDAVVTMSDLPSCYGDENLLNQLFSNIIGNAIKYRDKERRLVIEIAARLEFKKVIYSIKDNGSGIEPRHLEKIWDVFYRVDSRQADAGDGLGLSIVQRIAEKHNGKVRVESEPGKGSVFYVELQGYEFSNPRTPEGGKEV